MKPSKATVSILSLIASGSLGVDAMVFDDTVLIPKQDIIANERVEVKQVDNIVEARAPWKGEPGINIKYDMGEPTFTDRIKDRRKKEAIYETVDFGDGGFKVDVLLTEKPDTNRFCYTIEGAENYDFFYQPPLTEQEKAEGAVRPPEIEGSYAVYHKTLKNHVLGQENYATGKVMHIPRPQVWEIGNEEATKQWADLSYENGQLCVTAPQDFLDKADYTNGVRIDPTFGYTTVGGTTGGAGGARANVKSTSLYTASSGDTITMISVHGSYSTNGTVGFAPYTVSGGILVTKLGSTIDIPITASLQWHNSATISVAMSAGATYGLAFGVQSAGAPNPTLFVGSFDTISGNIFDRQGTTWTLGSSWSHVDFSTVQYSIYATYENSGGGGGTSTPTTTSALRINNGTIRINNGTLDL